jgi:23S rRNA-/tRNA-specific pseudouridylate synthase
MVNNGAIVEQMFNDANGEHLFVFAKIEPVLEELRQQFNQPDMLKHFETLVRRVPENKEKLAGIRERIKMIQATMAERAKAQAATA